MPTVQVAMSSALDAVAYALVYAINPREVRVYEQSSGAKFQKLAQKMECCIGGGLIPGVMANWKLFICVVVAMYCNHRNFRTRKNFVL